MPVFRHFLQNASLVLANFAYINRLEHSLHFFKKHHAQKKCGHLILGHFVSKLGVFAGNWPFSWHNISLVLASFAYYDRLDHSLYFLFKYHAQKNLLIFFLALLCPNYAFLWRFLIVLYWKGLPCTNWFSCLSTLAGFSPTFKLHHEKY